MILCHFLSPLSIVCPLEAKTKDEVITSLTQFLAEQHGLKHPKKILKAIQAREKVGSTFLPIGVAIPHARISEIDEIKMVMGILPEPLISTFEGEEYPTHAVCLFISPTSEKNFGQHLKLLARIAAVFRDTAKLKQLSKAPDAAHAFALVQRFEREAEELQSLSRREEREASETL